MYHPLAGRGLRSVAMSAQVSQAFVPLLSRPSGYVPAMPPKARPADVVGDDLSDRYIFVDAAKFGSYDVLYDDTTTVSDVVNRVSRMIGRNYFFPHERDQLAPDGPFADDLHLSLFWQRLDGTLRIVDLPLRPRGRDDNDISSWAWYGGPKEATWVFLQGHACMDILRQRGYVPRPPNHLRVDYPELVPPAERVNVIRVVQGPEHLRLRDPVTNELVDIIVVQNPRGYVPGMIEQI